MPASVFKSASAIGAIPSRPAKLVPKVAEGGVAVGFAIENAGRDSAGAAMAAGVPGSARSTKPSSRVTDELMTFSL